MQKIKTQSCDIVSLLFLAPQVVREKIGLDDSSKDAFIEHFDNCSDYERTTAMSISLYYACRSIAGLKKSAPIIKRIEITAEVLHSLIQLTTIDQFDQASVLLKELIPKEIGQRGGRARADKYEPIKDEAQRLARQCKPESGIWKSRSQAVKKIKSKVQEFARGKGVTLSDDQLFTTIDGWLINMEDAHTLFASKRTSLTGKDAPSIS